MKRALWLLYWAVVTVAAAGLSLTAAIPFTGVWARIVGIATIAGVCMVGIVWAPSPGGARR